MMCVQLLYHLMKIYIYQLSIFYQALPYMLVCIGIEAVVNTTVRGQVNTVQTGFDLNTRSDSGACMGVWPEGAKWISSLTRNFDRLDLIFNPNICLLLSIFFFLSNRNGRESQVSTPKSYHWIRYLLFAHDLDIYLDPDILSY